MSDDNVVPLNSSAILTNRHEPVPDVVERLEWLLKEARAGEVIGIAYATVLANEGDPLGFARGSGWAGRDGVYHTMAAGLSHLQHRFGAMLSQDDS